MVGCESCGYSSKQSSVSVFEGGVQAQPVSILREYRIWLRYTVRRARKPKSHDTINVVLRSRFESANSQNVFTAVLHFRSFASARSLPYYFDALVSPLAIEACPVEPFDATVSAVANLFEYYCLDLGYLRSI